MAHDGPREPSRLVGAGLHRARGSRLALVVVIVALAGLAGLFVMLAIGQRARLCRHALPAVGLVARPRRLRDVAKKHATSEEHD